MAAAPRRALARLGERRRDPLVGRDRARRLVPDRPVAVAEGLGVRAVGRAPVGRLRAGEHHRAHERVPEAHAAR